jgi:hypothetical protein
MSRGDGYMHTAWIPCATLLGLEIEVCPDLPLKLVVSIFFMDGLRLFPQQSLPE